jgi:ATP-dependent Lon protease
MEIIDLSGYSLEEKVEIAKRHLVPKQRKDHGLDAKHVKLGGKVLTAIIQDYTRESGVRSLDRQLAAVMRFVAKRVAMEEKYEPTVKVENLHEILGPARFSSDSFQPLEEAGVAIGLAWTSVGGEILFIEASLSKGNGKLILTGNLGDVMKESATTALSYIKAHTELLGIDPLIFEQKDIHLHVPEGAIPKDGPSAGITMLTALSSLLTGRKVKSHLAMTGEITLRGKVLPVGGIKEKILAAKRSGMKSILLCEDNRRHVEDINQEYLKGLTIQYVSKMSEVIALALQPASRKG